jgi:hypothetical protein
MSERLNVPCRHSADLVFAPWEGPLPRSAAGAAPEGKRR